MTVKKKKVVIVGGGTAGIVIANRIQKYFDVVIIEKSKYLKYPIWFKIPLFIGLLLKQSKSKYILKRNLLSSHGRKVPFFESNLLGGASMINGCVHMLGSKLQWNDILKKFNANYHDLLESYYDLYSDDLKIKNKISLKTSSQNIIDEAFIKSLENKKIPLGNMDFSNEQACGPILNTSKKFFRSSVLSLIKEKKFKIFMDEKVEEVLFNENNDAIGIKTDKRIINSDFVILSGGVIGTCRILLNAKNKTASNNPLSNLKVGHNIKDHTNLRVNIISKKRIDSLNEISGSFYKKLLLVLKHFSGKNSVMIGTGATSAAHLDLDGNGEIDTRIQIVQFSESGRMEGGRKLFSSVKPSFSISITAIRPKSTGIIEINGDSSSINPMYLSKKYDIDLLKLALKFCIKLLKSDEMSKNILKIEDEDEIVRNPEKYIFNNFYSGYHLIGGSNESINSNFSVKNTNGLFICDASIFKEFAASNIHSSVVLVADIFAKKFINQNIMSNE